MLNIHSISVKPLVDEFLKTSEREFFHFYAYNIFTETYLLEYHLLISLILIEC